MTAYVEQGALFAFLRNANYTPMHWTTFSGWQIAESMETVYVQELAKFIASAEYVAASCDESTDVATTPRMCITIYIERNWQREAYLLALPEVAGSPDAETLFALLVDSLLKYTSLSRAQLASRWVMFAADGASVLQGEFSGVTARVKAIAPFVQGMHCMAHRCNLAANTLEAHDVVSMVVNMSKSVYNFYKKSTVRSAELAVCQRALRLPVHMMLADVETRWISHEAPVRRLLSQLPAVLKHVVEHLSRMPRCSKGIEMHARMTDLERVIALAALLPMLSELKSLIKIMQSRDAYVFDLCQAISTVHAKLDNMYLKTDLAYAGAEFKYLTDLAKCVKKSAVSKLVSPIQFMCDPHDAGDKGTAHYALGEGDDVQYVEMLAVPKRNSVVGRPQSTPQPVPPRRFKSVLSDVKTRVSAATKDLRKELTRRFPSPQLLSAFSIVYPQFYKDFTEGGFDDNVAVLSAFYGVDKVAEGGTVVPRMIDPDLLRAQAPFFMKYASDAAMRIIATSDGAPQITRFWRLLVASPSFVVRITEFTKLAKMGIVMVGGSVEDERTFSVMNCVKTRLRNRLDDHLELCVRFSSQKLFTLSTFPLEAAVKLWEQGAGVRGRYNGPMA